MGAEGTTLVLVAGYAGSGKTELAKLIAAETRWALLDKDTLTRPLVEAHASLLCGDPDDRQTATYMERIRPLEYQILMNTVNEVLDRGTSVVATAPLIRELRDPNFCDDLADWADIDRVTVRVVWVHADLDTMRRRLTDRGAGRDRWKLSHWDDYTGTVDMGYRPSVQHDLVDNSLHAGGTLAGHTALLLRRWREGSA